MGSKITLGRVTHRGEDRTTLHFDYDKDLIAEVRKIRGAKWSKTLGCWHVPHLTNLDQFLQKGAEDPMKPVCRTQNQEAVYDLEQWMKQYSYSENTVELYGRSLRSFFRMVDKPWTALSSDDIIRYNREVFINEAGRHRYTAHNIFVSAMKLFFKAKQSENLVPKDIKRPRRRKKLPIVLSEEEVMRIIKCTNNIKHRVLLMLIYSAGLRIGETLKLRLEDIDGQRRVIDIHQGKGKRDRRVPLSKKVLELLREYYRIYRPKSYLFEGEVEGRPYSPKSAQNVLRRAVRRADVKKRVTLHTLRHSYATHLMERGVGLRYIQEILGHSSPKTTMIYTHVSGKRLRDVVSPLDEMDI